MMLPQQQEPTQDSPSPQQSQWETKKTRRWFLGFLVAILLVGLLLVIEVVFYFHIHSFSFIDVLHRLFNPPGSKPTTIDIDTLLTTIIFILCEVFACLVGIFVLFFCPTQLDPMLMKARLTLREMIKTMPILHIDPSEDEGSIENDFLYVSPSIGETPLPSENEQPIPSTPPPFQTESEGLVQVTSIPLSPPDSSMSIQSTLGVLTSNNQSLEKTISTIQDVPPSTPYASTSSEVPIFFPNTPLLPHIKEFYGRETVYAELKMNIDSRSSTHIRGGDKVGKTWLLQYLQMKIQGTHDNKGNLYHVGYIDIGMPSCGTETGFVTTVLKALNYSVQNVSPTDLRIIDLERPIEKLKGRTPPVIPIICLDNVEGFSE